MPDCGGDFRLVRHSTSRRRRRRASKINSGGSGGGFASRGHQPTDRPTARPTDSHRLITTKWVCRSLPRPPAMRSPRSSRRQSVPGRFSTTTIYSSVVTV